MRDTRHRTQAPRVIGGPGAGNTGEGMPVSDDYREGMRHG